MIKREYKDIFVSQQEYNLVYEGVGHIITSITNIERGDYLSIYSENDREKKRPLYAICLGVSIMESCVHNRWQAQVRLINNKVLNFDKVSEELSMNPDYLGNARASVAMLEKAEMAAKATMDLIKKIREEIYKNY